MNYERLRAQLSTHEGRKLKPYVDTVGKVTIGVGRNLTDRGITDAECDLLLDNDIQFAELFAQSYDWYATLSEARQAVILDMEFNLGPTRFAGFKKMIAAIETKDWDGAAREMESSRWAEQVGGRAQHLAIMMRSGEWS